MKKIIIPIIGLAFFGAACTSSDTTESSPRIPITQPTVQQQGLSLDDCDRWANELYTDTNNLGTQAKNINPDSEQAIDNLISDGRELISETREMLDNCRHYVPAEASELDIQLDSLEGKLNKLERLR